MWRLSHDLPTLQQQLQPRSGLPGEEGEMSDDLVKHCMCGCMYLEAECPNCNKITDADRIEALTEQLEAARADAKEAEAYAEELAGDQVDLCRQLIAAEDKLAKAVEGLRGVMQHMPDYADTVWQEARATLAEIEGEKG